MFDLFSSSHLLILLVVLLVVVGPKDLPRLMHIAGQWAGKAKRMASDFKSSFDEMARHEELDKLRLEIEELKRTSNAAVDSAVAEANLAADFGPEPRSGEFQVTETPKENPPETPKEPVPAGEPVVETKPQ